MEIKPLAKASDSSGEQEFPAASNQPFILLPLDNLSSHNKAPSFRRDVTPLFKIKSSKKKVTQTLLDDANSYLKIFGAILVNWQILILLPLSRRPIAATAVGGRRTRGLVSSTDALHQLPSGRDSGCKWCCWQRTLFSPKPALVPRPSELTQGGITPPGTRTPPRADGFCVVTAQV